MIGRFIAWLAGDDDDEKDERIEFLEKRCQHLEMECATKFEQARKYRAAYSELKEAMEATLARFKIVPFAERLEEQAAKDGLI